MVFFNSLSKYQLNQHGRISESICAFALVTFFGPPAGCHTIGTFTLSYNPQQRLPSRIGLSVSLGKWDAWPSLEIYVVALGNWEFNGGELNIRAEALDTSSKLKGTESAADIDIEGHPSS